MQNRLALLAGIALGLAACGDAQDTEREVMAQRPDVAARPDAVADAPRDADDTGVNTRDRGEDAKTPLDQSNAERDLELTRQIRQQIMDAGLSTDAENVKVITDGGVVTLRGPVESEEERQAIVAIARGIAGGQVDNQLEVATD